MYISARQAISTKNPETWDIWQVDELFDNSLNLSRVIDKNNLMLTCRGTIERLKILVKNNDTRSPTNLLTSPLGPTKNTIPGWPSLNYHNPQPALNPSRLDNSLQNIFSQKYLQYATSQCFELRSLRTTLRLIEICHLLISHNTLSQNFAKPLSSNFSWDICTQDKWKKKTKGMQSFVAKTRCIMYHCANGKFVLFFPVKLDK